MEQFPELWYVKTGTLYKQSKWLKVWRRRILKLYGSELRICRRDTSKHHIVIHLNQVDKIETSQAFEEFAFKIVLNDGEKYYFVADDAKDQQEWMTALEIAKLTLPMCLSTAKDIANKVFMVGTDQRFYIYENGHKTNQQVLLPFLTARQKQKMQLIDRRQKPFTIQVIDNGKTPVIELESDRKSVESISPNGFATTIKNSGKK